MALASPPRSSSTLDRYLRHGPGSKGSHSSTTYTRSPTKPKKFQSAHFDETTGTWRCKYCGHTYPNPEPHHHQRRAHKKICPGGFGKVHRWLSFSAGDETEGSQENSNVVDKPTTSETSDSAATQHALGEQDKNTGLQTPHLSDREFRFHETPSKNELPKESEIQDLGGSRGILSDQHGFVAASKNLEARRKDEPDSEPVTEKDFKDGTGAFGRLLTLDSDFSLPRELSLDISDPVVFSGEGSSDFVPVSDVSASGDPEGRDINRDEPLPRSSQDEAHSLKVGEDVLTADDTLKKTTEVGQGVQSTPSSSDESGLKDPVAEELGEGFHRREPSLNAAEDDTQERRSDVLQLVEESQMNTTEDRNAEELRVTTSEGFGETEAILPAAADDGDLRDKEDDGSEQGIVTICGDGTEYKSGDELESSRLVRGVGDEEASQHATPMEESSVVHATEKVGGLDGHDENEEVDAISLEPLSDDAEGVIETPPRTSRTGPPVKLSSAERNWDDWDHVVSGDDTSDKEKLPSLPQEIDEEGPPFSDDGLTSSQSDKLEDNTGGKNAPTFESRGTAVWTSDQDVGHEIGFQPAGLDWTLDFPDTANKDVDKQQPVDSLESSTSADNHASPDQDGQELIPGLHQETDQTYKEASRLSAAEANWDDWEDVIKGGPLFMKGITLRKEQDPESSGDYQTQLDSLGDVSGLGQGKTGTVLKSESLVEGGIIDTAEATGLPVHVPDSNNADWLIDFSEPSVEENNPGTANEEAIAAVGASSPKLKVSGMNFLDLLDQNEGSGHEGVRLLDSIPVTPQSETGQSSKFEPQLSSALRNWEDWDHVVRESERMSRRERSSPVLQSDVGDDEQENRLESSNRGDSNIVDNGSSKRGSVREGKKEVDDNENTFRYESGQAVGDNLWEDDWEVVQKNEYPPAGSRHSSPSFEDAHDGELSSEREYPTGLPTAVNLPLGTRHWADWEDLTNSEYMVLDGPDGESLVFKRTSDASGELSTKGLGGRRETAPSFEEPDDDGGSTSLRRSRRQAPSFDDDNSPSSISLKGTRPGGVVKSDYSAGPNSFQGFETTSRSLPASSPRKSESGDVAPLVTRRPLIYRGSRRDYTSEVEDQDLTSEPPLRQHLHHHNHHEHEDALKYDVEKVLRGQTTYELICPICGALITRKIIIRKKKKGRLVSEGDSRWRRGATEITPLEDDGNRSPRSDISSELEDVSGAWKQGIRPCFGYFFTS